MPTGKTGQGLSVVAATVVMTAWNLGICAGILIGGHLGQLLYNLKPRFTLVHLLYSRFCFPIPSFRPQFVRPKISTMAEGSHEQVCAVVDGDHYLHGPLSAHVSSVVADSGALHRFCCDGGSDRWCAHGHHEPVSARSPPICQRPGDAWFRTGFPPALNIYTWPAISSLLGWGCALTRLRRLAECRAKAATRLRMQPALTC